MSFERPGQRVEITLWMLAMANNRSAPLAVIGQEAFATRELALVDANSDHRRKQPT